MSHSPRKALNQKLKKSILRELPGYLKFEYTCKHILLYIKYLHNIFFDMYTLVNSNFSRLYNPSCRQNALGDIKRLLTSRDPLAQSKACGYLIEVINRYEPNSNERSRMVEYLLDNDVTVFLCEATSTLDFSLFRSVLECIRLIWRERRFFIEENAVLAMAAVVRALSHYTATDAFSAVDTCLHFICDLLNGIRFHETTSPLSHQSAYSTEQLLSCFTNLSNRICNKGISIMSSALVLHALISYQPDNLNLRGNVVNSVVDVLDKWFKLLMGVLNHTVLVGDSGDLGMLLVVSCQLGMESLRLSAVLEKSKKPTDFVQKILNDEQEITLLEQTSLKIKSTVQKIMNEIIIFVKDNQDVTTTEEYSIFLKFLLRFMNENRDANVSTEFCDILFSKGYLTMLPQTQIMRNDVIVRKMSTLVLGEMLKVLAGKYLFVRNNDGMVACNNDIQLGLVELQYGVEKPQNIGKQLQKNQPYSLLIYIYFFCQSSENPEKVTAPLLPYLVEHILRTPITSRPPGYIVKALWLMSTVSNGSLESLEQRVYLEKATDRLVSFLYPDPTVYYTHNPAILFWTFTSLRISYNMKLCVLSEWFKIENSLPEDLAREPIVWELLLNVLLQNKDKTIISNCMNALNISIEDGDDGTKEEFSLITWSMLPDVLSKALIDCQDVLLDTNITYLLDIATSQLPSNLEQSTCLKVAVLISTLFSKTTPDSDSESRYHYEFVCLKLCLLLLGASKDQSDNKVSLTYISRASFLPRVLWAARSADAGVAGAAVRLLTHIVYYFTTNNYEPKSVAEIQTDLLIKYLRQDSDNERGASLLQLIYMILNSGVNTPLVLTYHFDIGPSESLQCNALRALMFRVQLMLCSRDTNKQSPAGWKTLSAIFKHAIVYKNDPQLVATLTSQPWTHTLIRFQLTQNLTQEFLTFTQNWLTLLKITIKKNREVTKYYISKYSLISRTLVMLKNNLIGEDLKESRNKVLEIVNDIIEYCQSRD